MLDFLIFIAALLVVIKSADLAINFSGRIAKDLNISGHMVGFLIVALISVIPETSISVIAALKGEPSLGLGTLFGSNVADLTLIFAIIIFVANRTIKVKSKIIKSNYLYLLTLLSPLVLGLDGHYTRVEGIILVGLGVLFYYWLLKKDQKHYSKIRFAFEFKNFAALLLSMGALLIGSFLTVNHGVQLAETLRVSPALIGLLGISLGTTLPELFFSIRAVKSNQDELALGDILGTVITDAVIVVGIVALITPFTFPVRIVYLTGVFMFMAAALLFHLMHSDRDLTKKEGFLLLVIFIIFVITELIVNT